MLLGGDEMGRTHEGNNNVYCQDNELSWLDWTAVDEVLLAFTRALIVFRREHAVFRRRDWFQERRAHGKEVHDITWFNPDGAEMSGRVDTIERAGRAALAAVQITLGIRSHSPIWDGFARDIEPKWSEASVLAGVQEGRRAQLGESPGARSKR